MKALHGQRHSRLFFSPVSEPLRWINTWHREDILLSDTLLVGYGFNVLQNKIIGGERERKIAGCEFWHQAQFGIHEAFEMDYMLQWQLKHSKGSVHFEHHIVVFHLEECLDSLPDKAENATPKTISSDGDKGRNFSWRWPCGSPNDKAIRHSCHFHNCIWGFYNSCSRKALAFAEIIAPHCLSIKEQEQEAIQHVCPNLG